ncbi:MAG: 4Fe-4S binding protein [Tissierellales bacterium]|jgi:ferredoxin|nr:4Fe-4S binding protein [Tissierellales bacterium]
MEIRNIFEKFEENAAYTFATINGDYPETRIAHFLMYDDNGLYFQTMKVKPFYKQLKKTSKVSVCSLVSEQGAVSHDEDGLPDFAPGYFIKLSGDCKEIEIDELVSKAQKDKRFLPLVKDIQRYPTMTTFVVHSFSGEVFDYDFEKKKRDHKIYRERFAFGGAEIIPSGFFIEDSCVGCGLCKNICSFNAIVAGKKYFIDGNKCDECGMCYVICPKNSICAKNNLSEKEKEYIKSQIEIN